MSVDEWVTDQVSDIRDFLYALKILKVNTDKTLK